MQDLFNGAAWIQGRVIPISEAAIPVTDWGVTHSDIAYDVVPVWQGGFFRLDDYVARFLESVAALRMEIGRDAEGVKAALAEMISTAGLRDAYVAMVAPRGRNPVPGSRDPRDCANHFYAWCVPYVHVVAPEKAERGTSVWIAKRIRRIPDDSVDPTVKNYHWGDFTGGLFEAKDNGFETVLLLDHAGNVTEGPGFNAFAVFDNRLVTPDRGILHGITRRTVLEMATEAGMAVKTRPLRLEEFMEADEVFLSSSGGGVIPVARVDDRLFSNGVAGPVATGLRARYFDWMMRPEHRTKITY